MVRISTPQKSDIQVAHEPSDVWNYHATPSPAVGIGLPQLSARWPQRCAVGAVQATCMFAASRQPRVVQNAAADAGTWPPLQSRR